MAIKTISRATGIRFVNDGATDEQPSEQRAPYQPGAYGDRWAPLLISWTTPDAAPKLKGKVIGTGGSTHYSYGNGPKSFVTGSLELDAPQMAAELGRPDGAAYATAVILHELGHVMGLEHVDDPVQLMYPEIGAPDGLAAGDLNGLQSTGQGAVPQGPVGRPLIPAGCYSSGRLYRPRTASASSTLSTRKIRCSIARPAARLCSMGQAGNRRSQCSRPTSTMGVMVSWAP